LNISDGYFYHIFEFLFNWSVRLMIVGGLVGIIFAGLALLIGTFTDYVLNREDVSRRAKIFALAVGAVGYIIDITHY
jgi:hypothetical protein